MNIARLANLAAALLITASQGTVFSSVQPQTQSAPALAAPVADDVSQNEMPVVVVTAHRHQF